MALVFSSLAFLLADVGLASALVQREELREIDRSTAFWVSAALGTALTLAAVALAGPIASLYGEPEVENLFRVLSLSFLFTTLGTTQGALLIRDLQFRSLELRTMVNTAAGVATAIVIAARGGGAWALIGQQVVSTGVSTALLWRASNWRPHLVFSRESLRELIGFGGFVFGSRFLFYLNRNVDNFLVGRYLGAAALGPYTLAYNVMLIPLTRLAQPVQQVFFPAMTRIRDPIRIGRLWLRASRVVAAVAAPALLGLAVVAPDFVVVVLGSQWDDAVPVLQILTWVGLLQALQGQNEAVLQTLARTRTLFRFSLVATAASIVAYAVGLAWGIVGVAAAYAVAMTVVEPYYAWLTARRVGVPLRDVIGAFRGVLEAAVSMAVIVLATRLLLVSLDVPPSLRLVAAIAVGVAVYVPLCRLRAPEVLRETRSALAEHRAEPA
jgi:O-antigen/teichoic acid export membrane protein